MADGMMKITDKILGDIRSILHNDTSIHFAYLFGSQVKDTVDHFSDVDIGIYLDQNLTDEEKFKKQLLLISQLCSKLKREDIDLIILNKDNVTINHSVMRDGILLFERDRMQRIDWEADILSKWFDWEFTLKKWKESFEYNMEKGLSWQ